MLTHRQARRKLGSRKNRRVNTNGKHIWNMPTGKMGRVVFKYRFPRPASRKVAVATRRLIEASKEAS